MVEGYRLYLPLGIWFSYERFRLNGKSISCFQIVSLLSKFDYVEGGKLNVRVEDRAILKHYKYELEKILSQFRICSFQKTFLYQQSWTGQSNSTQKKKC